MQIILTESFQRDVSNLEISQKEHLFEVLLKLPTAIKTIHSHSGLGLRKIHPSGIFEARLGLNLRLIFAYKENSLSLQRVGCHDDVKKYLKNL